MIEKKEWLWVIIAVIIMSLVISFSKGELVVENLLTALLISAIIILAMVFSKEITARYIDTEIEFKTWEFQRFGIVTQSKFHKPVPIGFILSPLLAFLSFGYVKFLGFLQFELKATPAKVVKKYGQARYSGIMEWDDALVVFYSTLTLLILGILAKIFTPLAPAVFPLLARYSWIYVISNLIPISKLDGTKLFFGSIPLFIFTWILALLAWPFAW